MKAFRLFDGCVKLEEVPRPVPVGNEVLVKVLRAGICKTDLEVIKGYKGFQGVLGHEFVGEIAEDVSGSRLKKGQKVVAEINQSCGLCDMCLLGGVAKRNHCQQRKVLGMLHKDGCFSEYITITEENLCVVPENVSSEAAVFVEPLAAACRITEQISFEANDKVAVIGDGKLGLLVASVLHLFPHNTLVLFGKHADKMELVADGITREVVDSKTSELFENNFDICVEASGTPGGVMLASAVTRPMGRIVLKTTCASTTSKATLDTTPFVVKEQIIQGSRCGNFEMALNILQEGKINVERFLDKSYPFYQIEGAMNYASQRGVLKVQLVM